MKRAHWKRIHRWIGLPICLVLALFALSGILLNHRNWLESTDISRKYLPSAFAYEHWNQGLLRGTLRQGEHLLIYGSGGVFRADSTGQQVEDFNQGLPQGSDLRQARALIAQGDRLYLATQTGIYQRKGGEAWREVLKVQERFSDLIAAKDSLYALSRSYVYRSADGQRWTRIALRQAQGEEKRHSFFRFIWLLHSGELFGLAGRFVVDVLGLILLALCITGIVLFASPPLLRRHPKATWSKKLRQHFGLHYKWHNTLGSGTFVALLLLLVTGWMLRPPLLIAFSKLSLPPIPLTTLAEENPWHQRLRMLRYDDQQGDWLLSTSSGFYALNDWQSAPTALRPAPRVSPMGVNVWTRQPDGTWLVGSFSGLYTWQRSSSEVRDALSGKAVQQQSGPPFGQMAVAGYSRDLPSSHQHLPLIATYDSGLSTLPQPEWMRTLPLSLWNIALEVHTGRFYTFLPAPDAWWVFVTGLLSIVALCSGWVLRKRKHKRS